MSATMVTKIDLSGLERITKELEPRAEKVLDLAAQEVSAYATRDAPVDTGALKNSIHVESEHDRLTRVVSDGVAYGVCVELGHLTRPFRKSYGAQNFVPAQPFMTPAVETVRTRFEKMWEALFK